jgi:hypothetical protein
MRMQQRNIITELTLRTALALMLTTTAVHAETCTTRPAVGGGSITTCTDGNGGPPQQYRTRPGVGGTSITSGPNGRTCTTREGVGGRTVTTCR